MYAATVSGNIDKVHNKFDKNYLQSIARGTTVNNPIGIVFKAYLVVPYHNFKLYIRQQHEDYLDGKLTTTTHLRPLTPTEEAEVVQLSAANKQAELMQWHYRLGHLTFPKLKQLALNGRIPKKLAKVLPPKCAGCLFGTMTKLPWQGKETKANHEVFVTTKHGECILVDQMTSTEVGFLHNERQTHQEVLQMHHCLC